MNVTPNLCILKILRMSKIKPYSVSMLATERFLAHAAGLSAGFIMFTLWLGRLVLFSKIWFPELWCE